MAAKQIILTYATGASLEVEIVQLTTGFVLDNADGVFRAIPAQNRVPVPETSVLGIYRHDENRTTWSDGGYIVAAYLTGTNNAIASSQMNIVNDAEVIPPVPTSGDLTTLDDVKAWLNIASGNTNSDAVLTRLITASSRAIETYLSRKVLTATYSEKYNGNGRSVLMLRHYPILAISSITVDNTTIPARTAPTSTGFVFDDSSVYMTGFAFTRGAQNVEIQYSAGYDSIPSEIAQAAIDCVAFAFRRRERIGIATQGIAAGGENTSYTVTDIPKEVKWVLDQFRNVVPPMA